ncbi:hypothetical protein HDU79_001480 [Rhizoclosmatium sp. JEL0117]|nr:hypothetical protein HDU79_001480 [Rhizoclosmatium sp. JEL0117]
MLFSSAILASFAAAASIGGISLQPRAQYCTTYQRACLIQADPWVVPLTGDPTFEVPGPGNYYALQADDMNVIVHMSYQPMPNDANDLRLVVDTVTYNCGNDPSQTQTFTISSVAGQAYTVLNCYAGSCAGTTCQLVVGPGSDPRPNVGISQILYFGSNALGGLCYDNDPSCPTTPNPVTPSATPSLPGGQYCDPTQFTCTMIADPHVSPFHGLNFDFDHPGITYAINTVEMQVTVNVVWDNTTTVFDWLIVREVWFTCGGQTQYFNMQSTQLSQQTTMNCNVGTCQGTICRLTLEFGTDPVPDINIVELMYFGTKGIGGLFVDQHHQHHQCNQCDNYKLYLDFNYIGNAFDKYHYYHFEHFDLKHIIDYRHDHNIRDHYIFNHCDFDQHHKCDYLFNNNENFFKHHKRDYFFDNNADHYKRYDDVEHNSNNLEYHKRHNHVIDYSDLHIYHQCNYFKHYDENLVQYDQRYDIHFNYCHFD